MMVSDGSSIGEGEGEGEGGGDVMRGGMAPATLPKATNQSPSQPTNHPPITETPNYIYPDPNSNLSS